ncbi:8-oxo-dGTP diphosphatase [Endozoicomonas arenosclerae]|uniref:8-oxo-dGTP diphosphatase n=1 Tax=Endozoicomonas arenosclerae TaxID=1633495 RepID=UPI0007865F40|nr:8-oxo-dGTP diphosphatase [Endozoicomonas arenosclerae]
MQPIAAKKLSDIDWENWKAKDPATLTFVVKDDHILLIRKKRGLGAGKINGPGGRLEEGETTLECAVREVQEELKITPLNMAFHGECLFQFIDGYSIHVYAFAASDYDGIPEETDEAIPLWFHVDDIPYDEMWEDDRCWLPLLLKKKNFMGRYLFDKDKMLDYEIELLT